MTRCNKIFSIKERKKCARFTHARVKLSCAVHRTPSLCHGPSFFIKPNKHKGLRNPVNTRNEKIASTRKGFPRTKILDFGLLSWTPYGCWSDPFGPPKKPENKPKNIFKIFCKKSPKLPFGALFDKSFAHLSIHQTWIAKVQTMPRWIISSTTPTWHNQLTRHHSELASIELWITHWLHM